MLEILDLLLWKDKLVEFIIVQKSGEKKTEIYCVFLCVKIVY